VRKFSRTVFVGVPLSTKLKDNRFYGKVTFKGREQSVLLSQIRLLDARRLHDMMGELPAYEVQRIKEKIQRLVFG
jgi:mRNA interferase MazF